MRGVIAATVFKEQIERVLIEHRLENCFKVSENNCYILGLMTEFDFLLLKKDSQRINNLPIYNVHDVIAVIESKTNGVRNIDREGESGELKSITNAYNEILKLNPEVRLGYMTMTEFIPKNKIWNGRQTKDFWKATCKFFEKHIKKEYYALYAASFYYKEYSPNIIQDEEEWEKFVLKLTGRNIVL